MRVYTLQFEQFVPHPIERVFAFFARPENLERITPPTLHFSILSPRPVSMRIGALIDYQIRIRGIPQRWRTRIVDYDPPRGFVDEQVRGPYRLWIHRHTFVPAENGTVIADELCYALPLGVIGRLAHAMFVRRELQAIFAYRRAVIAHVFCSEQEQSSTGAGVTGNQQERTV